MITNKNVKRLTGTLGPKTYEKKAKQNKHVKAETKQTKNLGFLGNVITNTRIGLLTYNQAYVCRLDYAYADPCPENPKNRKTEQNFKTTLLTP